MINRRVVFEIRVIYGLSMGNMWEKYGVKILKFEI
jgi:hypothetical protein